MGKYKKQNGKFRAEAIYIILYKNLHANASITHKQDSYPANVGPEGLAMFGYIPKQALSNGCPCMSGSLNNLFFSAPAQLLY